MRVDFDEGELEDLREAVGGSLRALLTELARADKRNYRAMLKEKCARLERLAGRLDRAATPAERAIRRTPRPL